jgi:uncharacterized membrane protein YhhN
MKKVIFAIFVLASLVHLVAGFTDHVIALQISKPLIMLSLLVYYIVSAKEERSLVVILAIVFSLAGDVLLMYPDRFVPGLLAFLVSHIFYIIAYRQHRGEPNENTLQGVHRIRLAFPIILAATGLVIVLYPLLGELRIPVMVYATILAVMALQALFRYGRTTAESFWMVFSGAVLFMVSDSMLAINKFLSPVSQSHFWIMLTYITAQFLIVKGLLKHQD